MKGQLTICSGICFRQGDEFFFLHDWFLTYNRRTIGEQQISSNFVFDSLMPLYSLSIMMSVSFLVPY